MSEEKAFEGWCVLELMGHRRLGGYIREQEIAGSAFLQIDVPGEGGAAAATQFYGAGSVYCLTPTTEATARAVAAANRPAPVQRWELPAPKPDRDEAAYAAAHEVHGHDLGDDEEDIDL